MPSVQLSHFPFSVSSSFLLPFCCLASCNYFFTEGYLTITGKFPWSLCLLKWCCGQNYKEDCAAEESISQWGLSHIYHSRSICVWVFFVIKIWFYTWLCRYNLTDKLLVIVLMDITQNPQINVAYRSLESHNPSFAVSFK